MADIERERAWMRRMSEAVHGEGRTTWALRDAREMEELYREMAEAKARTRARSEQAVCHYCGLPWRAEDRWVVASVGPSSWDTEPYAHRACYERAHPDHVWFAAAS